MKEAILDFNKYLLYGEDISAIYNIPGIVDAAPMYYITSYGRVLSTAGWRKADGKVRELQPTLNSSNYFSVKLQNSEKRPKTYQIDRLVLYYFGGPIPDNVKELEANHKNRNHFENNVQNLVWTTHKENMQDYSENYTGNRKVTKEKIDQVLACLEAGYSNIETANIVGLSASNVNNIKRGMYIPSYRSEDRKKCSTRSILSKEEMYEIRQLARLGATDYELAQKYNKSTETIAAIRRNQASYKDIFGEDAETISHL